MLKEEKINVLGTEYKILRNVTEDENIRIKNLYGCCDYSTKEILISSEVLQEDTDSMRDLKAFENKVIRHEIIHAYLFESGLRENSNRTIAWAENEEMIDWIAIQSPKIFDTFKKLKLL